MGQASFFRFAMPAQALNLPDMPDLRPPNAWLMLLEGRAPFELAAAVGTLPWLRVLRRLPKGDGHPVLVFPGLGANDLTTAPLRLFLNHLGYVTQAWGQGFNFGPRTGVLAQCKADLLALHKKHGRPVSLIGWSLGGIYARELAKELPDLVRCVVTLGTPFAGPHTSTNAWRIYQFASGRSIERETENYNLPEAPPVPTTSIYSRSDGVVAWRGSLQASAPHNPHTENIEVVASHFGIGLNPSAWWVVADRLAQPQVPGAAWQAFKRPALPGLQLVFPDPHRPR